jgi:hypothetical protein
MSKSCQGQIVTKPEIKRFTGQKNARLARGQ